MEKSIYNPRYKQFQKLLSKKRKKCGITQIDFAKKVGLSQANISKIESGDVRVDIVQLEIICKALQISLSDFIIEFEQLNKN